jgi:hypothetical protein
VSIGDTEKVSAEYMRKAKKPVYVYRVVINAVDTFAAKPNTNGTTIEWSPRLEGLHGEMRAWEVEHSSVWKVWSLTITEIGSSAWAERPIEPIANPASRHGVQKDLQIEDP